MIRGRIRRPLDPRLPIGSRREERKRGKDLLAMSPYGSVAAEELDERRGLYSQLARDEV